MRSKLEIKRIGESIGAEVVGVDAASLLDEAVARSCLDALEAYGLVGDEAIA